ncbi:MAG: peptidylprolyl isomerase [Deltaproteobacteria bacterium]|nr:peptidylprolyl isomerase [Deltaproteobacteria bacterium]
MLQVKKGQFVQVHYTGRLEDGTVFDSSEGRQPLEFQAGAGQVIPGLDNAVLGMSLNDEKTVSIPADEAYGQPRDDLKRDFPVSMLGDQEVTSGQKLWFNTPQGPIQGTVVDLDDEIFTVDFNHPLAGHNLEFDIKVVGISDEPTQSVGCSCSSPNEGGCSTC